MFAIKRSSAANKQDSRLSKASTALASPALGKCTPRVRETAKGWVNGHRRLRGFSESLLTVSPNCTVIKLSPSLSYPHVAFFLTGLAEFNQHQSRTRGLSWWIKHCRKVSELSRPVRILPGPIFAAWNLCDSCLPTEAMRLNRGARSKPQVVSRRSDLSPCWA